MGGLIIFLTAIAALSYMMMIDEKETKVLDDLFEYIKTNNGIEKTKLHNKLSNYRSYYIDEKFHRMSDWRVEEWNEEYTYIGYTSMGNTTGKPVRFLTVYYDKSDNFIKAELEIGMSNTIKKEYIKSEDKI